MIYVYSTIPLVLFLPFSLLYIYICIYIISYKLYSPRGMKIFSSQELHWFLLSFAVFFSSYNNFIVGSFLLLSDNTVLSASVIICVLLDIMWLVVYSYLIALSRAMLNNRVDCSSLFLTPMSIVNWSVVLSSSRIRRSDKFLQEISINFVKCISFGLL